MHLYGLYFIHLVETSRTHLVKSYRPCTCSNRFYRCWVCGWFCKWAVALGLRYLGIIYHSSFWAYIDQKFQNAPCRSSRYHKAWIYRDQCKHNLPNAAIYCSCVIFVFFKFSDTMLLLDNCFWCYFRNSNKLNS